jgi:UDP-N-acetylmuramoyl-tripeptide--D-alanyl-D-alanine ligase
MISWDLDTVAAATGGRPSGRSTVTSVTTDSRAVQLGALFVALRGDRWDGHDFIAEAVARGAEAVVAERDRLPGGVIGVEVADTLAALAALAAHHRSELSIPVVAITGSSGKTSTKDLVVAGLGPGAHGAPRSFNNEVGVPLTVLGTPANATALVVEVGSRGVGHIAALADAIRPDVAVITGVGNAHLELFGDLATIARAKWELVEALEDGGVAVLPVDDHRLADRTAPGPVITFGPGGDVSIGDVALDAAGRPSFRLEAAGETIAMEMATSGMHQARNAAAAMAACLAVGLSAAEIAPRIASATLSPWRMEVHEGPVTIVNDAYNANPDSMDAALRTVAAMPGRHLAVLGRMHELGEIERSAHLAAGATAAELGFEAVVVVGDDPGIAEGAGSIASPVATPTDAVAAVQDIARDGDVVLVKASRAEGLEAVAAALVEGAT